MRLGIIGHWSDRGFAYVKSLGLSNIELICNVGSDAYDFAARSGEIVGCSKKYNVKVCSVGRFGTKRILEDGRVNEEEYNSDLAMISAASAIGSPVFLCGVNYTEGKSPEENIGIAADYLRGLRDYGEERGVTVLLYNCSWGNFLYDARGWDAILPLVPGIGIKYDPSHCVGRGGDPLKELRDYGGHVKHFHVKGTIFIDGKHFDDPPAGMDMLPWGAIMDILYAHNYSGALSIEPHSRVWTSGPRGEWGIRFTIDYISKFLMPEDFAAGSDTQYMP